MTEFHSIFKDELRDYLTLRVVSLSQNAINHDICYLSSFDAHLTSIGLGAKVVSEMSVNGWIKGLTGKTSTKANKVIVIRIFLKYLQSQGYTVYIPPIPRVADDYIPYIFTDEELTRIFDAADSLRLTKGQTNPHIQLEFPMILRLLCGCGFRIGEILTLQMKDVDLNGGILTILHAKMDKQRLVPMSASLTELLQRYCLAMGIIGKPNAFVFPSADCNKPVSVRSVRNKFDVLIKNIGLTPAERNRHERGPCMHCFRHVFAFKSFAQAESDGRSVDESIPFLSIYLGHESLNETDKYLKFSSELYPDALKLFECYTETVFPEVSV
jgi:integrase